jgi:four helix bundle protein
LDKIFDLKKRSFDFSLGIIKLLETLSKNRNYITEILGKQLLRSGTSIGANIVEGQSAASKKEFANFYKIALKSANETKYWLDLLINSNKENSSTINILQNEVNELSKIIAKSIITIKEKMQSL